MKPDTLKIFTDLAIEEIKDEMKELMDFCDADDIDSASYRDIAEAGQTIADIAAALVNLYLTAADELDRIIADRIESLVIKGVDPAVEPVGILSSEEGEAGDLDAADQNAEEELRESESRPAHQPDPERERKMYLSNYVDRLNTDFDEYIAGFIREYSGASHPWGERYDLINALIYLVIECAIELGDDIMIDLGELLNVLRIDIDAIMDKPEDDAVADRSLRRDAAERIGEGIAKNPERYAMTMCWLSVSHDLSPARYYSWSAGRCAEYSDPIHLKRFICVLQGIGFELPDELRAYLDGTHPIYTEDGCSKIYAQRDGSDE